MDISALSGLTNLTRLYLRNNQITDFSPIAGLIPNLTEYGNENQTTSEDVNGDSTVNILDLVIVANAIGKAEPDVNGDGIVNILDLVIVANAFTK